MADKYKRSNFCEEELVDDNLEMDLVNNHFDLFEIKRPTNYFTVSRTFIQRPDLLSLKVYGKMNYWWIIFKVNNIDDIWNDLHIDDVLQIPDIRDIEDWYIKVKSSRRIYNG